MLSVFRPPWPDGLGHDELVHGHLAVHQVAHHARDALQRQLLVAVLEHGVQHRAHHVLEVGQRVAALRLQALDLDALLDHRAARIRLVAHVGVPLLALGQKKGPLDLLEFQHPLRPPARGKGGRDVGSRLRAQAAGLLHVVRHAREGDHDRVGCNDHLPDPGVEVVVVRRQVVDVRAGVPIARTLDGVRLPWPSAKARRSV